MQEYQRRFIDLSLNKGVLKFGRFVLKSGRVSPYFFNAGGFCTGEDLATLGSCYAHALIDSKISLELIELNNLISNIDDIKVIDKSNLEQLYYQKKNTIDNFYHSSKIEEKSYNICIQFLNDIFNYYISGYPDIPDEYLYHDE